MIAGQVTRETPVSPARLSILQATLDPALLDRAGVDVVILHRRRAAEIDLLDSLTERARQQLGDPVYQDDRFAVFNVPDSDSVPDFTTLAFNQPDTDDRAVSSLYTPQAGWVDFSGRMEADDRAVELYLDDQRVHTWMVDGIQEFSIPLRLTEAGYHSVSLALDPPCPPNIINPTLQCRSLTLHDLNFVPLTVVGFGDPVRFDRGLTLAGVVLPEMSGSAITVRLWWQFEQALHENEIRFVHVLNSDGNPVAQDDTALGAQAAGSAWTETVTLVLPEDLPPGAYRVTTGWYSYPDLTRFDVLAAVPGAENDTVELGILTINP